MKLIIKNTLVIVCGLFTYLYLINFYICDDAYISFRSWENLLTNGIFSYNIDERVQAYTNVLWTILSGVIKYLFYGIDHDPNNYWNVVFFLSYIFSLTTIIILYREIKKTYSNATFPLIFCFLTIFTSKAFVDFTSSGLEYPLAYFFITIYFINYFNDNSYTSKQLFYLSFIFGLSYLSRTDSAILIFLPSLYFFYQCYLKNGFKKSSLAFLLGISPLIAWLLFQIIYYGFIFPNTAYGKLGSGSNEVVIRSGINYFFNTLVEDPITIITLIIASIGIFFGPVKLRLVSVSIILSLIYVINTGGDFMGGRFFAIPFLVSILYLINIKFFQFRSKLISIYLVLCILIPQIFLTITTFNAPIAPTILSGGKLFSPVNFWKKELGISFRIQNSDKYYYYPGSSFVYKWFELTGAGIIFGDKKFPFNEFHAIGSRTHCLTLRLTEVIYEATGGGGILPFCKGPNNIVIDKLALSDPLLARLNYANQAEFLPGHNVRNLPAGYIESRKSNQNLIEDKNLAMYYGRIHSVVNRNEELFTLNRIGNILYLNFVQPKYKLPYY